jgi:hypothetical protein
MNDVIGDKITHHRVNTNSDQKGFSPFIPLSSVYTMAKIALS